MLPAGPPYPMAPPAQPPPPLILSGFGVARLKVQYKNFFGRNLTVPQIMARLGTLHKSLSIAKRYAKSKQDSKVVTWLLFYCRSGTCTILS